MCTLTWFVNQEGYELFFNRDERLTRRRAKLPTIQTHQWMNGKLAYISPTDADAGGTWIATNEFGITVCLLNHYQFEQIATYKKWISRGEIVRQFSKCVALLEAENLFNDVDLDDYRAFRMFMIQPSGDNRLFVWDGHSARVESNVTLPKSSSSVDAKHVKARRRQLFSDLNLDVSKSAEDYRAYHASHFPSRSKDSVCMHREDAQTVSFSHVRVSSGSIEFQYADGPPCEVELASAITLPLRSLPIEESVSAVVY